MIIEAIDPDVQYEHWPTAVKPSRRCLVCSAYLSRYTSGTWCAPCTRAANDRKYTRLDELTPEQMASIVARQVKTASQRARRQEAQNKRRAAAAAALYAEVKPDGVKYLNVTQAAWCLGITVGEVVMLWRRGEIASASRGRGSKIVVAMSELERWKEKGAPCSD